MVGASRLGGRGQDPYDSHGHDGLRHHGLDAADGRHARRDAAARGAVRPARRRLRRPLGPAQDDDRAPTSCARPSSCSIPYVVGYGIWWAYGLAFVASTVSLFFVPAKRSLIPDLVGTEQLMAANSLDNASEAIAEIVGLALGAAIVATVGYSWAFTIDGITFLVSAGSIALIRYRQPEPDIALRRGARLRRRDARGRARHLGERRAAPALRRLRDAARLFAAASIAVCYALALERYDAGAVGLAMLDGASAVGMLVGAVLVGAHGPGRAGAKFLAGMALFGFVFALVALATSIWTAMMLLVATGIANMFFFIPATTLFQTHSEPSVRGRVMAANTTATRITMVLGIVIAGAVADKMPLNTLIVVIGFSAIMAAALGWMSVALREA